LDVESFDYAYFPRGAKGFRVAIANALDQAVVNQDGFYIAPGMKKRMSLCCTYSLCRGYRLYLDCFEASFEQIF
jgi:hypothetical protein